MNGPPEKKTSYRFTFGPWNISMGADPFGPTVRKELSFAAKIREYKKLGFDGVQFHDDDAVEADLDPMATKRAAARTKKLLDGEGLFCEFIAPRLWEHPQTVDGGYHRPTVPRTAAMPWIVPGERSISPTSWAAATSCSGWRAKGLTSAKPRIR